MQNHCTSKVTTPRRVANPAAMNCAAMASIAATVKAASVAVISFQWCPGVDRRRILSFMSEARASLVPDFGGVRAHLGLEVALRGGQERTSP